MEVQKEARRIPTVDKDPKQGIEAMTIDETERQTRNLRYRWKWAEASIWTDNMLAALAIGVKGNKWFSLIDKVYKIPTLNVAWDKVRSNKGAAGIDMVTIEKFGRNADKYLTELHEQLKMGTYQPQAVKRVYIPKGGGKVRPLGIPIVKDRVAQQAVKLVLEPILDKEFLDSSYGFRPERGAKDALRKVDSLIEAGYTFVVDADLQSYFDTIPHDRLMQKLSKYISDGKLMQLINLWLKQDIMEEGKTWTPDGGTPQGGVLSPLLANLYLHDLDQLIHQAGGEMVRYADDFVILNKNQEEAEAMYGLVQKWVTENGLILHPEKTHIGNCLIEGCGFDFLGYRFESGKRWVRKKSIQKLRDTIRRKTRRTCGQSLACVIENVNKTIKGWYEYFKHVNKWGLQSFDSFIRRRLRAILKRQNKENGFGCNLADHMRWTNAFFAEHGLFTMEDKRRHEIARQSR